MRKYLFVASAFVGLVSLYACNKNKDVTPDNKGTVYVDIPATTYKYYQSSGRLNDVVTLGRVLFYERRLSVNNSISCGSCHKQQYAFADNVAASRGFQNRETGRNSPSLQNLAFSGFSNFAGNGGSGSGFNNSGNLFWDGREHDLKKLISRPISNHVEMGIDDVTTLPAKLAEMPYYSDLFTKAYGSSDITLDRMADAMSYFVGALQSTNTRLDQSENYQISLNGLEAQGQQLFQQKYNCASCHNENINGYFSGVFADIGLDATYKDLGVGAITGAASDRGRFKVPNLRNVALTAPYMHDGRFATLNDVLEHYSHGINNTPNLDTRLMTGNQPMKMNISTQDKQALIAFLNTLTDADLITNPYFADPFKTK